MVITAITAALWITVMYATPPESDAVLDSFYRKVRPGGPGWKRQRERTGLPGAHSLAFDLKRILAALCVLFGLMFGVGAALLLRWTVAVSMVLLAALGTGWLLRLRASRLAQTPS